MTKPKLYDCTLLTAFYGEPYAAMEESETGEYVSLKDYLSLKKEMAIRTLAIDIMHGYNGISVYEAIEKAREDY
jgi:hypothetical protein